MDKTRVPGAPKHMRPNTAQAALCIHSNGSAGASVAHGKLLSSHGSAHLVRNTPGLVQHQLLQLQESQKRCQELQADNSMLKQALSASVAHVQHSRPNIATPARAAVKLSRSTSAITSSTLADEKEAHQSALQGQVAGLKLQLMSASAQVQNLTKQLEVELSNRKAAEQQKQHLWESQLLQQQQWVTKDDTHQRLLQQVMSHDAHQQKLVQKLQGLEQQNKLLSQQLCYSRESLQTLIQQCQELQKKVQASDDSHKQLLEKLEATEQSRLQLEQAFLSNSTQQGQEELQQQVQSLQTQLSTAQHSMVQQQAQMQRTVDRHSTLQEQQAQQLQQQSTEHQRQDQICAELQAKNVELMTDMTVLQNQSLKDTRLTEALHAKLAQLEAESAKAASKAVKFLARNDVLTLSEASLRLQLGQASESHKLLVSQHEQELRRLQQRPGAADVSVQASLSHAVHAVACQADMQHSTVQTLQAQLLSLQEEHAESLQLLADAAIERHGIHSQLAESQKQQWKLTACQQEAEAAREVAEAAQEAAEACYAKAETELAAAKSSASQLEEQLAAQHTQIDSLKAEASQQAAGHKAQAEAQAAELQSLYKQLADHKQAMKQHPWAGTAKGIARLPLPINGGGRPHTAWPTGRSSGGSSGREWQQLSERMGEVERLQSNVARDAAAMQAMGVLVEAKALKLDMLGSRPSSAGGSLTQTIRLQQQVRQLQMRLLEAQAKSL